MTLSRDLEALESQIADVVVVGAGAVGITVGLLLARSGLDVVILEAGQQDPSANYLEQNAGPNSGVKHDGILDGRVRALGGTTRLWGGQLVPFSPADFENSPGRPQWPLNFEEIAPWYTHAFRFLGIDEALTDDGQMWAALGLSGEQLGDSLALGLHLWLPEPDFSRLFARELHDRTNLRVFLSTEVRGLAFSEAGNVRAVKTIDASGVFREIRAKYFIAANGTMEISRLLLNTARAEPNCPLKDNKHLGRHFVDHLHGVVGTLHSANKKNIRKYFDSVRYKGVKFSTKIRLSNQAQFRLRHANCAATLVSDATIGSTIDDARTLLRRLFSLRSPAEFFASFRSGLRILQILTPSILRYVATRRADTLVGQNVKIAIEIEQLPTESSYLFIDPDDATDYPRIGLNWGFDGSELEAARTFCQYLSDACDRAGLGKADYGETFGNDRAMFFSKLHDANHHIGGARMASTADQGVVDANLKAFGVDNLFVLGAATFPTGSFANPTLTALAFAHRLAAHILDRCASWSRP